MTSFRRLALFAALAAGLLPTLVRAADPAPALAPAQQDQVNQMIHDYLLSNPKVLIEALEKAEAEMRAQEKAKAQEAVGARREELNNDPTSPVIGNPKGDVTIVEFFDYRCPYCKSSAPMIETLLAEDKGVRLVLKDFPILGKESVFASRVALVTAKHGKYPDFYKAMFALKTQVTEESTLDVVKSIGLDPAAVKQEMEAADIDAILKHNYDLGRALGADGTPAFVIGDSVTSGALTGEELRGKIAALRAKQPS
ncbi:MAG TPA: DsbA family protein [Aliidongia sp.]|nr:DsbA family protein [Aliidongia sp.]